MPRETDKTDADVTVVPFWTRGPASRVLGSAATVIGVALIALYP